MADLSSPREGVGIGQALRDLPLEAPMQSIWPTLALHLRLHRKKPVAAIYRLPWPPAWHYW